MCDWDVYGWDLDTMAPTVLSSAETHIRWLLASLLYIRRKRRHVAHLYIQSMLWLHIINIFHNERPCRWELIDSATQQHCAGSHSALPKHRQSLRWPIVAAISVYECNGLCMKWHHGYCWSSLLCCFFNTLFFFHWWDFVYFCDAQPYIQTHLFQLEVSLVPAPH